MSVLDPKLPEIQENVVLDVRSDVRRLLDTQYRFDAAGDSETVTRELAETLSGYPDLSEETRRQIMDSMARQSSPFVSVALRVTDDVPDDFDKDAYSEIILYDENGRDENSFMDVVMQHTIYGTRMSASNVSDIEAYMKANRKKRVALYIGAPRAENLTATDMNYSAVIESMAQLRMPEQVIEDTVKSLMSGDAPTSIVQIVEQIVELAKPQIQAQPEQKVEIIQKIETLLEQTIAPEIKPSVVTDTLVNATQAIVTTIIQQDTQISTQPVLSEKIEALKIIADVVQANAALIKDPALPAVTKDTMHVALTNIRLNILRDEAPIVVESMQTLAVQIAPLIERAVDVSPKQNAPVVLVAETSLPHKISAAANSLAHVAVTIVPPAALTTADIKLPQAIELQETVLPHSVPSAVFTADETRALLSVLAATPRHELSLPVSIVPVAAQIHNKPNVNIAPVQPASPLEVTQKKASILSVDTNKPFTLSALTAHTVSPVARATVTVKKDVPKPVVILPASRLFVARQADAPLPLPVTAIKQNVAVVSQAPALPTLSSLLKTVRYAPVQDVLRAPVKAVTAQRPPLEKPLTAKARLSSSASTTYVNFAGPVETKIAPVAVRAPVAVKTAARHIAEHKTRVSKMFKVARTIKKDEKVAQQQGSGSGGGRANKAGKAMAFKPK